MSSEARESTLRPAGQFAKIALVSASCESSKGPAVGPQAHIKTASALTAVATSNVHLHKFFEGVEVWL
ncbi:hypothetical protein A3E20_00610 [Candidatus Saccharibacteria bacterium RIFCSPHIGHO2_12_FULL_47_16]|nr:MAG: hypothetical protein A3E20_00610 [Candidatus Saccharibacteria bacterium RIFCSPHIGHO2_12_FULL_47_16]